MLKLIIYNIKQNYVMIRHKVELFIASIFTETHTFFSSLNAFENNSTRMFVNINVSTIK